MLLITSELDNKEASMVAEANATSCSLLYGHKNIKMPNVVSRWHFLTVYLEFGKTLTLLWPIFMPRRCTTIEKKSM